MLSSSGDSNRTQHHLADSARKCAAYRLNCWNGYVEWVLGELGIFPRIFAAWCWHWRTAKRGTLPATLPPRSLVESEADLFLATLVERWEPLATFSNLAWPRDRDLVNATKFKSQSAARDAVLCFKRVKLNSDFEGRCPAENQTAVIVDVVRQIGDLSRSGLASADLKPNDLLVRVNPATGKWEGRLSDLEAPGTRGHSTAGVVPGMHPKCVLLINSFSLVTIFACGPTRDTKIAREFVVRILAAIEQAEAGVGEYCTALVSQAARGEHDANTTTGAYRDAYRNFQRTSGKFKALLTQLVGAQS